MTLVRDPAVDHWARLAARVRSLRAIDGVRPPAPGTAVFACRCGAVLDAADMRRAQPAIPTPPGCLTIRRITCEACA